MNYTKIFNTKIFNTIVYLFVIILMCIGLIQWSKYLIKNHYLSSKEGYQVLEDFSRKILPYPRDALINNNDLNSPLYSHTVDLPLNTKFSCKNFCGPKSTCAITGEQCTSDIDCYGCNPGPKQVSECLTKDIPGYEDSGVLGSGVSYSNLTNSFNKENANFSEVYPDSSNAELTMNYQGYDKWTPSFNEGLRLYNKAQIQDYYRPGSDASQLQHYPLSVTTTGQFYNTIAPAANANIPTNM